MKIILNMLVSLVGSDDPMPEYPRCALSVGEDEDGTILVGLIGSLPTSHPSDDGKVWHVQSGHYELLNPHDAEEVADAARCIGAMDWKRGDTLSERTHYHLIRIADVIYGAWREEAIK